MTAPNPAPLTEERLAEIAHLMEFISPEGWRECGHDRGGCQCGFVWDIGKDGSFCVAQALNVKNDPEGERYSEYPYEHVGKRHAAFIAQAPTIIRELLSEIDRLNANRNALIASGMNGR